MHKLSSDKKLFLSHNEHFWPTIDSLQDKNIPFCFLHLLSILSKYYPSLHFWQIPNKDS